MKKKLSIALLILVILLISITLITLLNQKPNLKKETPDIATTKEPNSSLDFTLKYLANHQTSSSLKYIMNYNNQNIYYRYNDIELYICQKDNCETLKEALTNKKVSLDDIYAKSKDVDIAYDGGSKIYKYNDFNIVACHHTHNNMTNNDIIIGDTTLDADLCHNN